MGDVMKPTEQTDLLNVGNISPEDYEKLDINQTNEGVKDRFKSSEGICTIGKIFCDEMSEYANSDHTEENKQKLATACKGFTFLTEVLDTSENKSGNEPGNGIFSIQTFRNKNPIESRKYALDSIKQIITKQLPNITIPDNAGFNTIGWILNTYKQEGEQKNA